MAQYACTSQGEGFGQEMASNGAVASEGADARSMGIPHCPLCFGLALLSALRFLAHAVMLVQLELSRDERFAHPAELRGTVFEL